MEKFVKVFDKIADISSAARVVANIGSENSRKLDDIFAFLERQNALEACMEDLTKNVDMFIGATRV